MDLFSDLVIVDAHAPYAVDVTHSHHHAMVSVGQTTPDVSQTASDIGQTMSIVGQAAPSRIRPRGKYLEAIRKLYKDVFFDVRGSKLF